MSFFDSAAETDDQREDVTPTDSVGRPSAPGVFNRSWGRLRGELVAIRDMMAGWPSVLLLVTIALNGALGNVLPTTGLDGSWHVGLNTAQAAHIKWGRELVYTYGPWGYLDLPSVANGRSAIVLGMLFGIVSVAVLWLGMFWLLAPVLSRRSAAVAATIITTLAGGSVPFSSLLFAGIAAICFGYVGRRASHRHSWVPALVGGVGAFLLQMKTSEGMVVLALAGIAAITSGRKWWLRTLETIGAAIVVTILAWLLAGQRLSYYPHWLHGTLEISSGYTDAMGDTSYAVVLFYASLVIIALVLIGFMVRLWRRPERDLLKWLGILLMTGGIFEFSLKQAARSGHEHFTYVYLLPVVVWFFFEGARRTGFRAAVVVVVVFLSATSWYPGQPNEIGGRWFAAVGIVADTHYYEQQRKLAKTNLRASYKLSPTILSAIQGHSITVDNFDASLPWAYNEKWAPQPTMQDYVAYTAYLDQTNADAISSGPADRRIMRSRVGSLDARNALWDSPRYVKTEICNYRPVASDNFWLVLAPAAASRCGQTQQLSTVQVRPGQQVPLPTVGADTMLLMSFHEKKPGLLNRLGVALLKSFHPLHVFTANYPYYRLPRALADGPLIVSVPSSAGWPQTYTRYAPQSYVGFSEPGSVEFSTVTVSN